jgi:hypothetical protein
VTTHLKIDEVTTGASLSMETSSTTKNTMLLNPVINPEKYEPPCQVEDLIYSLRSKKNAILDLALGKVC